MLFLTENYTRSFWLSDCKQFVHSIAKEKGKPLVYPIALFIQADSYVHIVSVWHQEIFNVCCIPLLLYNSIWGNAILTGMPFVKANNYTKN